MLDKHLQTIQELNTFDQRVPSTTAFGIIKSGAKNGNYAIVIDQKGKLDQFRGKFKSFFRGLPIVIIFNKKNDLSALDKIEQSVDTEMFFGLAAQKIFKSMKIISQGTGQLEARVDTVILRKIKLRPFKENSILVMRVDGFWPTKISKTTREKPASVYFRAKGKKDLKEGIIEPTDRAIEMLKMSIFSLIVSFAIIFGMLGMFIASSKEDKKLSEKLNNIMKDGRTWKVYIIKDDSPNAFCIATPRMFIHTGLKKILNEEELMGVMLHEAGHIQNKDMWTTFGAQQAIIGILVTGAFIAPVAAAAQMAYMILMLTNYLGLQTKLLKLTLGRRAERRADSNAVKYGYGKELASALDKMGIWMKKQQAKRPCGKMCKLIKKINNTLDEHPPLQERVSDILKETETWKPANFRVVAAKKLWAKKLNVKK